MSSSKSSQCTIMCTQSQNVLCVKNIWNNRFKKHDEATTRPTLVANTKNYINRGCASQIMYRNNHLLIDLSLPTLFCTQYSIKTSKTIRKNYWSRLAAWSCLDNVRRERSGSSIFVTWFPQVCSKTQSPRVCSKTQSSRVCSKTQQIQ